VADDFAVPYLDVYPYDDTTAVTLEVRPPGVTPYDAGTCTPSLVTVDIDDTPTLVQRWTAPPVPYGAPFGYWVFAWEITGTGADAPEQRFHVPPPPSSGGPTWVPSRARVATYIPERTVEVNRLSGGAPVLDFTDDTRPTSTQVDQQIEDAVGWVTVTCGDVHSDLFEAARGVAAIRAAGMAEISWPVRDGDINAGQALLTQADNALKALAARNESLTGVDPDDPDAVFEVVPVFSFPPQGRCSDYIF
jgi:hypothetical protein